MKRRLAYIMGPNYSGTTLLTLLLADHPQIATVGELKATSMGDLSTYRCSCGDLITVCPFWNAVKQKMHIQGRDFSFGNFKTHFRCKDNVFTDRLLRASIRNSVFEMLRSTGFLLSPTARKARQDIIDQHLSIIDIICTLQKAETFLDDSKEPVRLKFLQDAGYWKIRTIQLIRDGRGVTNSYMRHNKATMVKAAQEWIHTQKECNLMAKNLGKEFCLVIHYEDLCREPEKTLSNIHLFLGLEPGACCNPNRIRHIMGNQMRLATLRDIKLDEKWTTSLQEKDMRLFETIAGKLNSLHGYS